MSKSGANKLKENIFIGHHDHVAQTSRHRWQKFVQNKRKCDELRKSDRVSSRDVCPNWTASANRYTHHTHTQLGMNAHICGVCHKQKIYWSLYSKLVILLSGSAFSKKNGWCAAHPYRICCVCVSVTDCQHLVSVGHFFFFSPNDYVHSRSTEHASQTVDEHNAALRFGQEPVICNKINKIDNRNCGCGNGELKWMVVIRNTARSRCSCSCPNGSKRHKTALWGIANQFIHGDLGTSNHPFASR